MAIALYQQPTTPNAVYTNLVYVMYSTSASNAQFRYITDIYESGSSTLLTRLKTYPDIDNTSTIDVSRELQDYLDYDQYWTITGSLNPVNAVKDFEIHFGEEYGTSLSSSITLHTSSITSSLELFPGRVYKNESSYNFNFTPYIGTGSSYLTNDPATQTTTVFPPTSSIFLDNSADYRTISMYKDNASTPTTLQVRYGFMQTGSAGSATIINITQGTDFNFTTFGVGPQNLADYDATFSSSLAAGNVNYYFSANDPGGFVLYINDLWDGIPTTINGNYTPEEQLQCSANYDRKYNTDNEYTRFSWINQYGFWDYFNVYAPSRLVTQVDRSYYHRPFVRYGNYTGTYLDPYDVSFRGNTQYKTEYRDNFEITTPLLTKQYSDWLTEMFESKEVFIQKTYNTNPITTNFVPVNILNTRVNWQLGKDREKLFQYTIQFKLASDRQSR